MVSKNLQVSVLISDVSEVAKINSERGTFFTHPKKIQHAYSVVHVFPGSARSQLR